MRTRRRTSKVGQNDGHTQDLIGLVEVCLYVWQIREVDGGGVSHRLEGTTSVEVSDYIRLNS